MSHQHRKPIESAEDIPRAERWLETMVPQYLIGGSCELVLKRPTRTLDQSAKFHAICGDVAAQAEFMGRTLTKDQWKVLFVSGHSIATGSGADMVPGIEGEYVNLRESTAAMSRERLSSLIEYTLAWCAEHEVELRESRNG